MLADRTQAPRARDMRWRTARLFRMFCRICFAASNVRRLAPFFRAQRDALTEPGAERDKPRIVLLTPGPYNETYFEHSYLARYLGFTLVEGADLTVRDRRSF